MALVIVRAPLRLAGTHGQQGLAAIKSLNLAFLVHAEHQGPLRWRQVEPHDVAYLLH